MTYERILKKSKFSRRVGHKNKHLQINSLGLTSFGPVLCLVCKQHGLCVCVCVCVCVCLFPMRIHFHLVQLGSTRSVQSPLVFHVFFTDVGVRSYTCFCQFTLLLRKFCAGNNLSTFYLLFSL